MLSFTLSWHPLQKLNIGNLKSQKLAAKRRLPRQTGQSGSGLDKLPIDILLEIISHLEHNCNAPVDLEGRNTGPPPWIDLTRVCRRWYHDLTSHVYRAVHPSTLNSCHLLLRTFINDPALGNLVASLSFPEHPHLYSKAIKAAKPKPGIILQLIQCCPNLVDIRIPVDNTLVSTGDIIHTNLSSNLPHLSTLVNLTGLHMAAFGHRDQDIHLILEGWLSLAETLPCVEWITLSCIGSFTPVKWPRIPRLHSVKIFRPRCTIQKVTPNKKAIDNLVMNFNPAPKILHISGIFDDFYRQPGIHPGFLDSCLVASHSINLANTLESLTLLYPMTRELAFRDEYHSWANGDLAHMSALRRLEIRCSIFHRNLLLKPPPQFEELVITITDLGGSPKLDVIEILKTFPATMRTLILKLNGYSERDAWIHLAHKHYAAAGMLSTVEVGIAKQAEMFKEEIVQLLDQMQFSLSLTVENGLWSFSFLKMVF